MSRERPYFGPAVTPDRNLRYTSVSSLQSFDEEGTEGGCNRKWWGTKVGGWEDPGSPAQDRGIKLHGEIEHYFLSGEDVRGPVTRAGAHLLPRRGPDIFIEQTFGAAIEKEYITAHLKVESDAVKIASMRKRLAWVEEQLRLPGGSVPLLAGGLPLVGFIDMRHQRGEYVDEGGVLRLEEPSSGLVVENLDHKALDVNTPILTTRGWKTIGSVNVGDLVFASDGTETRVTYISPVTVRPTFRIVFDDRSTIIADGNHQWSVLVRSLGNRISRQILTTDRLTSRMAIDMPQAVDSAAAVLPVDPYVMGAWLGDGQRTQGVIFYSMVDDGQQVIEEIQRRGYIKTYDQADKRESCSTRRVKFGRLHDELRAAGYLGLREIPDVYLLGSYSQRLDLMKGLLDTDGTCRKRGQVLFSTIRKKLSQQVIYLARSLGFHATVGEYRASIKGVDKGPVFQVTWEGWGQTFCMTRKQARIKRAMPSIRSTRRQIRAIEPSLVLPVRCIAVEHPSHCFLAGDALIVTHNTTSNIKRWAKEGANLVDTVQMIGYGVRAIDIVPDVRHVRLSHVYYQTRGTITAKKSTVLVPVDEVRRRWHRVNGLVDEMRHVASKGAVEDVRPNFNACSTFGGCPHQSVCPRGSMTIYHALGISQGEPNMSNGLFDVLAGPPALPPIPEPPISEIEREARIVARTAELQAQDAVRPCGAPGCGAGCEPGRVRKSSVMTVPCPACLGRGAAGLSPILPPDAALSSPLEDAAPLPPEAIAEIQDPALRVRVEEHARLHAEAKARADAEKTAAGGQKASGNCPGGKQRVVLAAVKARGNKATCPRCGRALAVKPAADGSAILPGHRLTEKQAGVPPLPLGAEEVPPLPAGVSSLLGGVPVPPVSFTVEQVIAAFDRALAPVIQEIRDLRAALRL